VLIVRRVAIIFTRYSMASFLRYLCSWSKVNNLFRLSDCSHVVVLWCMVSLMLSYILSSARNSQITQLILSCCFGLRAYLTYKLATR